jgi:hypothetical protein
LLAQGFACLDLAGLVPLGSRDLARRGQNLPGLAGRDEERIQAAVVICARGQVDRLSDACELAEQDWRDVLTGAGLADEDWRSRLETELGPAG